MNEIVSAEAVNRLCENIFHGTPSEDRIIKALRALLAERDAMQGQIDALRKDAERYRWLRESEGRPRTLPHVMQATYVIRTGEERRPFIYDANGLNPKLLDAAIDAALAGVSPK